MSEEADQSQKTAKPTPKRISDFRKRGDIAISRDLAQVSAFIGGAVGITLFASTAGSSLAALFTEALTVADGRSRGGIVGTAISAFLASTTPVVIGAFAAYAVCTAAQLGWPPAFKWPKFNLGRVFAFEQAGQLFSPKAAFGRVANAGAKIIFVGCAVALALAVEFGSILSRPDLEPSALARACGVGLIRLTAYAGAALAALAALDFLLAKRKIMAKMKMTPEELKREHKEQEGDPHVRATRKRRAREIANRRHAVLVPKADVVLVNPTEYAVAIRYDAGAEGAPRVIAKGRLETAARIREIARRAGVPIIRRPPLTRLIYKLVREGHEIPADLYQVVAEVLAYVYRLRARHG